ncbi:MAG TPA: AMP-binding protein [bacterium]
MIDKTGWELGATLARQAKARGDYPFLQFQDDPAVTYAEVDAIAHRVSRGVAALGAGLGDRVGVWLPNGLEILYAWFGVSRAGAVSVFVNTAYKGGFLEHVLNNAAAKWVILAAEYLPRLAESEANLPLLEHAVVVGGIPKDAPKFKRITLQPWEDLIRHPAVPLHTPVTYRDLCAMMYTSGTTGPSKGVLMPHAHCYLFGHGELENLALVPEDVYYICMPLFHANALLMQLYGTLVAGATAIIVPTFSASRWLDDIIKYEVTVTNLLGVMSDFVWRQPPRPQDKQHKLRTIIAVPNPPEIAAKFPSRFGVTLIEGYGMTEVNICLYFPRNEPTRLGSCGKPYSQFFDVRIADPDTDETLPPGQLGEIVVRPKEPYCFMAGYNAMESKTIEAWRNFWFHTGDAGKMDADGYFYFVDRIKDTIRRRGENISSYEIEVVLNEHPAVAEAAAIAVKSDIQGGEDEVKACLVLKPGQAVTPEALLDFCQTRMPYFAVPRYVEVLPELPKTPTSKVQKAKLRQSGLTAATWDREAHGYKVRR